MKASQLVDTVVIEAGSQRRTLTLAEFHELPLSLRIRCVLMHTATFYCEGREVDRAVALDCIRLGAASNADGPPSRRRTGS